MNEAELRNRNLRIVEQMMVDGMAGQLDAVRPYVAEDFVYRIAAGMPYGGDYRGWEGYLGVLEEIGRFWSDLSLGPNDFAASENRVVISSVLRGTIARNGRTIEMPLCEVWEFLETKVTGITAFYFDSKRIAELAVLPAA